jgi:hypothetical protein
VCIFKFITGNLIPLGVIKHASLRSVILCHRLTLSLSRQNIHLSALGLLL